jgi:hypothetical protein
MNWADIDDIEPSKDICIHQKSLPLTFSNKPIIQNNSYSNIVKQTFEPTKIKEPTKTKEPTEIKINTPPKVIIQKHNKGRNNYCYTCKPRGKVLKHIIRKDEDNGVVFHFDLHKRPLILLTPIKHYNTLYDIPNDEIMNILEGIKLFCCEWNIVDYQVSFNNGEWQTHSHFHIKIKTSEKIINRLRRDHFLRIKLQQNYKN